jgi:hypothetical protein
MSVGNITTKATLDMQIGQLSQQIQTWTRNATNLNNYLLTLTEADLVALGYDATTDVPLLKSASGDMGKLASVFYGEAEQTPAYDFRTFVARVGGFQI